MQLSVVFKKTTTVPEERGNPYQCEIEISISGIEIECKFVYEEIKELITGKKRKGLNISQLKSFCDNLTFAIMMTTNFYITNAQLIRLNNYFETVALEVKHALGGGADFGFFYIELSH